MNYRVRHRDGFKEVVWDLKSHPLITARDVMDLALREFFGIPLPPLSFNAALFTIWVEDETSAVMGINWEIAGAVPQCWAVC